MDFDEDGMADDKNEMRTKKQASRSRMKKSREEDDDDDDEGILTMIGR